MTTEEKVKLIIANQLAVDMDEVTTDARFDEDLGADSFDVIELVLQFEDRFDLEIPDKVVENIKTVKDVLDYLAVKVK